MIDTIQCTDSIDRTFHFAIRITTGWRILDNEHHGRRKADILAEELITMDTDEFS